MKDSGMRIRVEQQLREDFLAACKSDDVPAAQVIRRFMKEYIEKARQHSEAATRPEQATVEDARHA